MSLIAICQAIQDSQIGTAIRESEVVFPVVETLHVIGLSVSVGLIVLFDLLLVGAAFRGMIPSQLMDRLKPIYLSGFALMFITGALLFWAEAAKCYGSNSFRAKITFLGLAGLNAFVFEVRDKPYMDKWGNGRPAPARARLLGWISIVCWICVIGFGRWTAYGLK